MHDLKMCIFYDVLITLSGSHKTGAVAIADIPPSEICLKPKSRKISSAYALFSITWSFRNVSICHFPTLWKLSKWFNNWNVYYQWTAFCEVCIWDEFRWDILYSNGPQVFRVEECFESGHGTYPSCYIISCVTHVHCKGQDSPTLLTPSWGHHTDIPIQRRISILDRKIFCNMLTQRSFYA